MISTLFPHLPRSDMRGFRIALAGGAGLILALSLLGLYPLALIVAAVLVPFLTVVYLWDVDLYEDEPLQMLAFTIVWGAAGGVAVGLAARHFASPLSLQAGQLSTHELLWLGVLLPLVSVALMVAGPLILLPYRRFNDVLDGATFGGACAVTFTGAEVITNSAGFPRRRAEGARRPDALGRPGLLTALGGASRPGRRSGDRRACGAFWLRYRAPAGIANGLGPAGSPLLALPLAAAAIVGLNVCELYLENGRCSPLRGARGVAVVGLRRVIHPGLVRRWGRRRSEGPCAARTAGATRLCTASAPSVASRCARSQRPSARRRGRPGCRAACACLRWGRSSRPPPRSRCS